jgi:ribosome-binding protein aMBF1 (putative translation factor)
MARNGSITRSDDVDSAVRARLRSLRRTLGWSLDDLAQRCHLSASTISRIEALLVVAAVIAWARRSSNSILVDILRR